MGSESFTHEGGSGWYLSASATLPHCSDLLKVTDLTCCLEQGTYGERELFSEARIIAFGDARAGRGWNGSDQVLPDK